MEKNFEQNLRDLDAIVKRMESGDVELEESLKLFEQGVKLSKICNEMLEEAEKKVSVLMSDGSTQPFGGESE